MNFVTKDSGHRRKAPTGAQRDRAVGKGRYDLISPIVTRRVAQLYERGALKYTARNWERGMPLSWFLDSAKRHLDEFHEGMVDEDHLAAVIFNVSGLIHTQEMIKRGIISKKLDDLPNYIKRKK